MRKHIMIGVAAAALALGAGTAGAAQAQTGPSNQCWGQITAGIASTWPWAHDDKVDFPPSPGSLALWLQLFGPQVGVSSVRDLQVLFCS